MNAEKSPTINTSDIRKCLNTEGGVNNLYGWVPMAMCDEIDRLRLELHQANQTKQDAKNTFYAGLYGGPANGRLYRESTPKDTSELFYEAQRLAGEPVEITFAPVPFPLSQVNDGITVTLRTLAKPQHAISDMEILQWNAPRSEHFDTIRMTIHHMCELLRQKRNQAKYRIHTLVYLDETGKILIREPNVPGSIWRANLQHLRLPTLDKWQGYDVRNIYVRDGVRYIMVRETT
jgi:hypothetical protein